MRYGPYAMFALLPAFAVAAERSSISGVSGGIPARPRLYGEHLVFAAHNHAFLFVVGSLIAVSPSGYVTGVLVLWMFVYLAWSTRAVYGGRWLGIAARAIVLGVAYAVSVRLGDDRPRDRGRPVALSSGSGRSA